jgi:hypothetical protein
MSFGVMAWLSQIVPTALFRRARLRCRTDSRNLPTRPADLPPEDRIDARENELKSAARDLADAFGELLLV